MGIPASELTQIRTDAAGFLDQTCVVQRKTTTRDAYGTASEVWNTIATVDAGMTQPDAGLLQNYDYLIGSLATWHVRLPYGTDCKENDQLVIGGLTLLVQVELVPQSYAAYHNVLAAEVK